MIGGLINNLGGTKVTQYKDGGFDRSFPDLIIGRVEHYRGLRLIGGHDQYKFIKAGIIILLTPAPIIDSFCAWKPPILLP